MRHIWVLGCLTKDEVAQSLQHMDPYFISWPVNVQATLQAIRHGTWPGNSSKVSSIVLQSRHGLMGGCAQPPESLLWGNQWPCEPCESTSLCLNPQQAHDEADVPEQAKCSKPSMATGRDGKTCINLQHRML